MRQIEREYDPYEGPALVGAVNPLEVIETTLGLREEVGK